MKAVCWQGVHDVRVERVPDPTILNPRDAIVRVSLTAICGSDLHLYDGHIPTMRHGDILGHEFMGEVVEIGPEVKNLSVGDRVVVPFPISCGRCHNCIEGLWSLCDNSNPNGWMAKNLYGHSPAAIYGYSHLLGGYAGGQAEFVRVPYADVGPIRIPDGLPDEQVLFLSDIFPTGYMAAESCNIRRNHTVAVWGCGPVGQFAIQSAFLLGARRVIAIDNVPERLALAKSHSPVEVINYDEINPLIALEYMTGGEGPDACIDAVGLEATGHGVSAAYDQIKHKLKLQTGRPTALREAIQACRKGGVVSIPGVYGGFIDKVNMGAAFNKGLTFEMGQTHVHRYLLPLLRHIENKEIDPSFIISHRLQLDDAPNGYRMFRDKEDHCQKVVLAAA